LAENRELNECTNDTNFFFIRFIRIFALFAFFFIPHMIVLESGARLSRSLLWQLQRRYFEQQGIQAWQQSVVPHFITSNTYTAGAYARVVLAYLKDCKRPEGTSGRHYILELGAGSGRFAYHFLKKFLHLRQLSSLADAPFTYVMSDFSRQNVAFWQEHAALRPYLADGLLDFAQFDAERDTAVHLLHSGHTLAPGNLEAPLVVLSNYFFDSIPQDAFRLEGGRLHESVVSLSTSRSDLDRDDPALLNHLEVSFSHRRLAGPYYNDRDLDAILEQYRERLPTTTFLFPASGIACVRRLRALAGDRLLLLSGDKGYVHESSLAGKGDPVLNVHGSFSLMVNYHALAQYTANQGGATLHTSHRQKTFNVCAFLFDAGVAFSETRQAYAEAIEQAGPDDFYNLKKAMEARAESLSLEQIVSYLRLSGWDSHVFWTCFPTLLETIETTTESLRQELFDAVHHIWDNYYPIGEKLDLSFHLGILLFRLRYYCEALALFHESLQLYGPDKSTFFNMAVCHHRLGEKAEALRYARATLDLDPTFEAASKMIAEQSADS
jgi:tetratricopeptide (TPR) repeat protein